MPQANTRDDIVGEAGRSSQGNARARGQAGGRRIRSGRRLRDIDRVTAESRAGGAVWRVR